VPRRDINDKKNRRKRKSLNRQNTFKTYEINHNNKDIDEFIDQISHSAGKKGC
jgi:hypothetical protein